MIMFSYVYFCPVTCDVRIVSTGDAVVRQPGADSDTGWSTAGRILRSLAGVRRFQRRWVDALFMKSLGSVQCTLCDDK